jgi:hypothetical protein
MCMYKCTREWKAFCDFQKYCCLKTQFWWGEDFLDQLTYLLSEHSWTGTSRSANSILQPCDPAHKHVISTCIAQVPTDCIGKSAWGSVNLWNQWGISSRACNKGHWYWEGNMSTHIHAYIHMKAHLPLSHRKHPDKESICSVILSFTW